MFVKIGLGLMSLPVTEATTSVIPVGREVLPSVV